MGPNGMLWSSEGERSEAGGEGEGVVRALRALLHFVSSRKPEKQRPEVGRDLEAFLIAALQVLGWVRPC